MVNKTHNNARRDAIKTLFKSIGVLGVGGWDSAEEKSMEKPNNQDLMESPPEDILNDWEHLLEDD